MKIAITGARGRLGRILRLHLEKTGHQVSPFSRNADANHLPLGVLSAQLDKENFDAILHLAWSTVPSTAENNPSIEWCEDLPLLSSLLRQVDARRARGVSAPRLVFFSSCSVYGEPKNVGDVFDETSPLHPIGWYARGKAQAEELIRAFSERGNAAIVLRVTNPYGFRQDTSCLQGVIPALISAALQGTEFNVWGDGGAEKDYLHIHDLCRAVDDVLVKELDGVFNLATGRTVPTVSLITLVENLTGRPVRKRFCPPAAWDVQHGQYSNSLFKGTTGWEPSVTVEEGVAEFVRGFQDQHSR